MPNNRDGEHSVGRIGHRVVRTKKRKPFIPPPYLTAIICVVILAAFVLVCLSVLRILRRPFLLAEHESAILSQKREELAALRAENEEMKKQADYFKRPDGVEAAARNLGYLKPGEQSIILQQSAGSGMSAQ